MELPPPAERPIFDAHGHLQPAAEYRSGDAYAVEEDLAFRLELMDRIGIRAAIVMASHVYDRPKGVEDTRRQNDLVAWYRNQHPDRFPVAIGTVEPNQGLEAGLAEIRRMHDELDLDGVVWHPIFNGAFVSDPPMVEFARELGRLDMPAFVHLNVDGILESATHLEALASEAPETTFVAVGAFSSHRNMRDLRGIGARCQNILFDTSLAWPMGQPILEFAETFGSERLIFGTDMHHIPDHIYNYPTGLLDVLLTDRLSEEEKHDVLWGTAERLFPQLEDLR